MGVIVHRSSDPGLLVGQLCDVIAHPAGGIFDPEFVSVPTRGIERWITEQIAIETGSNGSGVCANVRFPRPASLIRDLLRSAPGAGETLDGWRRGSVVGHLVALLEELSGHSLIGLLDRFVDGLDDGASAGSQRLRAARKIASLFDSYERFRPAMLEAWEAGDDIGSTGAPLGGTELWQPMLWRRLVEQMPAPPMHRVLPTACEFLRSDPTASVPSRISVYGLTAIDPFVLTVLEAVSERSDVHLFVLHPSPALWDEVEAMPGPAPARAQRGNEGIPDPAHHPLLRSWAQESIELQLMLSGYSESSPPPVLTVGTEQSLLTRMQDDIRGDRPPVRDEHLAAEVLSGSDRSLHIHACHGPQRQVEVLRDAILHAMVEDSTLEPRDIAIMTPDLETFAPLIETAFPSRWASQGALPDLRVTVADRAPSATNPLVRMAAMAVELTTGRVTAGDVTSLLAIPEVARRFHINDDMADEIASLVDDANVRWGMDTDHRAEWHAGRRDEHTWRRGLDRILTGVLYDDSATRVVADISPLNGVEGTAANAAGALAALLDAVGNVRSLLGEAAPSSTWPTRFYLAVQLLAVTRRNDEWQWSQLSRLLDEAFASGEETDPDTTITIHEAAMLIQPWTENRPSRLHHRTGDLTVSTLPPMRSVPYRMVCLLGLDHDRFPRTARTDGDDLLADDERIGDRDAGAEDRQLLLDAVMAARDRLVITYTGRDPRTNAEFPPAVPVSELLEVIDDMVGDEAAKAIVTHHPLQSFGVDVFTPDRLGVAGAWGFDRMHFEGAVARSARQLEPEPVPVDIAGAPIESPDLAALIAFHAAPSATFVDYNYGVRVPRPPDPPDENLPLDLDGLERWQLKVHLLDGYAIGSDSDDIVQRQRGLDAVPAGMLADDLLDSAVGETQALRDVAIQYGCAGAGRRRITGVADLGSMSMPGTVDVHDEAPILSDLSPSKDKAKRRLALFASVAWLSVVAPEEPWVGVMIGKGPRTGTVHAVRIGPFGATPAERADQGRDALLDMVKVMEDSMERPAPIFLDSAYAWQKADPPKRRNKVRSPWEGNEFHGIPGDRDDPSVGMLFPQIITVDDLAETDFPRLAERVWQPILDLCEEAVI